MSNDHSRHSQNETVLDAQSPMPAASDEHAAPPTTLPRYPETVNSSKIIMSPARAVAGTTVQAAGTRDSYFNSSLSNISRIPHVAASSSSGSAHNSSPESQISDSATDHHYHSGIASQPSLSVSRSREDTAIKPSNLHRGEFEREHGSPSRHRSASTESKYEY